MTGSPMLLMDTNVWLDRFLPNRPGFVVAKELIDLCIEQDVTILYPLRALNDVFWQVQASNKKWVREGKGDRIEAYAKAINSFAWDCIDSMVEVGTPVGVDVGDVWLARHMRDIHSDFEDDMVLAAAERAHASYLVTSDRKLIQKSTVAAFTPEDMLKVLHMRQELLA